MGSPHAQCLSAATRLIGDPVTIGEVFEFSMAGSTITNVLRRLMLDVSSPADALHVFG